MESKEIIKMKMDLAEKLQENCHNTVEQIIKDAKKPITYQDATNVWLFYQLASIQLELQSTKNKLSKLESTVLNQGDDLEDDLNNEFDL